MNQTNQNFWAYASLVIYIIVGAILRYFIIPYCNPELHVTNTGFGYYAIPYILIGIGFGLFSFIFPNRQRTRIAIGVVTGLSVGFGGMTVYALAFNPCI
jgi:hypothetical protein